MNTLVYLLKSFGVDETGGNPAGVVLNADVLSNEQKKQIAKEVGFSETAFVEKSNKADFKVSFFTPVEEVDLCGHATIATYSLLFQKKLLKPGSYTQEIKAGILGIDVHENGLIEMEQALPKFYEELSNDQVQSAFETPFDFGELRPQIVSTGLKDIFVQVKTRKELFSLIPNFAQMSELNKKTDSGGFHVFTLDTADQNAVAHCRNFCPLFGIDEESATGSSNGALASYLWKHGKLVGKDLQNMKFEQGYSMGKPSEIFVSLKTIDEKITQVKVGGKAVLFGEKHILL